jgi:hypothetical protein
MDENQDHVLFSGSFNCVLSLLAPRFSLHSHSPLPQRLRQSTENVSTSTTIPWVRAFHWKNLHSICRLSSLFFITWCSTPRLHRMKENLSPTCAHVRVVRYHVSLSRLLEYIKREDVTYLRNVEHAAKNRYQYGWYASCCWNEQLRAKQHKYSP